MIENNISKSFTAEDQVRNAVNKATGQILIGQLSEDNSVLEMFEFESDESQ